MGEWWKKREREVEKMKREKEKLRMRTEQRKENWWIKGGKGGKSESKSEKVGQIIYNTVQYY